MASIFPPFKSGRSVQPVNTLANLFEENPKRPDQRHYQDSAAFGLVDTEMLLQTALPVTATSAKIRKASPQSTQYPSTGEQKDGARSDTRSQDQTPPRLSTPQPPTAAVRRLPLPPREELSTRLAVLSRRLRYPAAQRLRFLQIFSIYMHFQLGGDINQAVQEYQQAVELFRGDSSRKESLRVYGSRTLYAELQPFEARTVGGQRLEALALLRDGLWNMSPAGRFSHISDSVLLEILEHFRWVVEEAVAWIILDGDIDEVIDRVASLRSPHPTSYSQDERWARFVTVTATNSHFSARQFLAERQYDYAAALNDWAALGYLPLVSAPTATTPGEKDNSDRSERTILGLRDVVANHESEDGGRTPVKPLDGTVEGSEIVQRKTRNDDGEQLVERKAIVDLLLPNDDEPSWSDDGRPSYDTANRPGFMLDPDSSTPVLGFPDPTQLHIERICRGRYAPLSHELKSPWDWDNPNSMTLLRKWRNSVYGLTTRVLKRPAAISFLRAETDYLYFEEARHFEHAFRQRMDQISRGDANLSTQQVRQQAMAWFDEIPMHYRMSRTYLDRITRRFNKKFAGKTMVDGVLLSTVARPPRTANSLNMQRHRSRMICRDFNLKYVPSRGASALPDGRTDDEDSDYEKGLRQPKSWVQPPADSDDTDGEDEHDGEDKSESAESDGADENSEVDEAEDD